MPKIRLNKRNIDSISFCVDKQEIYRDDELTGFGLRVGRRSKVFIVESQVKGRTVRVTVGRYGLLSPEQARKAALRALGDMASGANPNAKRRAPDAATVTVRDAFGRFFREKPNLARATGDAYRRSLDLYLADWADFPLPALTRIMILHRHQRLAAERGGPTANSVMRHLRSIYNFVAAAAAGIGQAMAVIT